MTVQDDTAPQAGARDGSWYLEMLGLSVPSGTSPAQQRTRSQSVEVSFELEGGWGSVSTPTPLEPPSAEQPAVPLAEATVPDFTDWRPNELAKQVATKSNVRWPLIVTAAVVVIALLGFWFWLPTTVASAANKEAADYREVIQALRALLPEAQQTLEVATDPAAGAIELIPLGSDLTRLAAASREVTDRASRPFPETLPMAPKGALEELQPTRDAMKMLGSDGTDIVGRLSATITYRTSLDGILVYPSLPVRADLRQIDGLSADLAETEATTSAILANLPLDPAFSDHRAILAQTLEDFSTWQDTYLGALANGDEGAAESLIADLAAMRTAVFDDLIPALATIRSDVDAAILLLNDDGASTIAAMPR